MRARSGSAGSVVSAGAASSRGAWSCLFGVSILNMKQRLNFTSDAKRFAWMRKHLYVPVVCDVLDSLGCRDRAMHQRLRPLDPENCVIIGRARTFRWMDADY